MPRVVYKKENGEKIGGVTTIIGASSPKPQLMSWAAKLAREGKDFNVERKNAADAGTATHAMIEDDIGGNFLGSEHYTKELDTAMALRAEACGDTYFHWKKTNEVEAIETELSLVSEKYGYGGTMDLYGRINGGPPCVADWKTSGPGKPARLYPEVIVQLAAYRQLLVENDRFVIGEAHAVCFGVDDVDHRTWTGAELDDAFALFLLYLEAYKLRKIVNRQV